MKKKTEFALGNIEFCFWQDKTAENVVFLFLKPGFTAFNSLRRSVLSNSNN